MLAQYFWKGNNMRVKIRLDTMKDVYELVSIATQIDERITITDGVYTTVSAKSILGGILAKMEFENIYCECEKDISGKLLNLIRVE